MTKNHPTFAMAKPSSADTRRTQIVAAMLPVLAEHGYERATIALIARQAGLAPGLIHYYFPSKREILVSLVRSVSDYADTRFREAVPDPATPLQRLQAYFEARLGLGQGASAEIAAAWVMIGAEAVRQPEVREVYQGAVAQELATLTALLQDCLREDARNPAAAATLAPALLAFMEGAFQLASAAGAVMPTGYAAPAALDMACRGMAAAPKTAR
jgi:TetR/AcrR family transcriptional regulator, transcriptional repressor of bet genes